MSARLRADRWDVRTPYFGPRIRLARLRSRFGDGRYLRGVWGERADDPYAGYWSLTRRPMPCLAFVLPILLAYELGVLWIGGKAAESLRTGADAWLRNVLAASGLTDRWLLPGALVVGLVGWQAADPRAWRISASWLLGMALESLAWAVALIGLSKLVDLAFLHLEGRPPLIALSNAPSQPAAMLVGYLGAGVYEEALFRLALIPGAYGLLRLLQVPHVLATTLAVTGSALAFSIAHHAGAPGETFTWFAFVFRWLAGVYFAWVFVARGFGIAVGTHAAYDILVGWLGWHF